MSGMHNVVIKLWVRNIVKTFSDTAIIGDNTFEIFLAIRAFCSLDWKSSRPSMSAHQSLTSYCINDLEPSTNQPYHGTDAKVRRALSFGPDEQTPGSYSAYQLA